MLVTPSLAEERRRNDEDDAPLKWANDGDAILYWHPTSLCIVIACARVNVSHITRTSCAHTVHTPTPVARWQRAPHGAFVLKSLQFGKCYIIIQKTFMKTFFKRPAPAIEGQNTGSLYLPVLHVPAKNLDNQQLDALAWQM